MVPQNGWFIREIPIKMDDLGVPLFLETPICHESCRLYRVFGVLSACQVFIVTLGQTLLLPLQMFGLRSLLPRELTRLKRVKSYIKNNLTNLWHFENSGKIEKTI